MQLVPYASTPSARAVGYGSIASEVLEAVEAYRRGFDEARRTSAQNISPGNLFGLSSANRGELTKVPAPTVETPVNTQPVSDSRYDQTLTTQRKVRAPAQMAARTLSVDPQTVPIQIWEGTVIEGHPDGDSISATLSAKMGNIPRHSARIMMEWISEQDRDLVRPGAVFYLTLYKRNHGGTIQNSQELRFRRRPSWSATQIKQLHQATQEILSNMRPLPTAP